MVGRLLKSSLLSHQLVPILKMHLKSNMAERVRFQTLGQGLRAHFNPAFILCELLLFLCLCLLTYKMEIIKGVLQRLVVKIMCIRRCGILGTVPGT